ncbi:cytochrome c1 [Candidatus Enterovibrio escicola]|uniref:Ubiquinol cytochrome C oxidoreductase, cytochrome C1 subunit n=1 Tax=Candidatus Enterovibrio escicola TaxID=1927127 RepID=A0A2A5T5C8_9GAMM|nr:cytochrome c1 [Candidatus Enterovibrio escacola]PCS23353.1 ubiquinol cytochrome C oxidoreductase, cytochrome C1 subunit [Candidatus Enterovibrio escacola]
MKKWFVILFTLLPYFTLAAGAQVYLDVANNDLSDKVSLQNGVKIFMNYCFGCHATKYQRYERIANDLDIPDDLMLDNLVFNKNAKIGDLITNAISMDDATRFFGTPAPDLTLVARVRGTDWIYTYLRSFYADPSRPFGVNNTVFPSVNMPHILEELQGTPIKLYKTVMVDGQLVEEFVDIKSLGNGELSPEEYDAAILDLVNFLEYSGEPNKLERLQLGYWVIGFLLIFLVLAILLKKEYWRDVH